MRELILTIINAIICGVIVYYVSSLGFLLLVICLFIPTYIIMKINVFLIREKTKILDNKKRCNLLKGHIFFSFEIMFAVAQLVVLPRYQFWLHYDEDESCFLQKQLYRT